MPASLAIARVVARATPSRVITRMAASTNRSRRSSADMRMPWVLPHLRPRVGRGTVTLRSSHGLRSVGVEAHPGLLVVVIVEGLGQGVVVGGLQVLGQLVVLDPAGCVGAARAAALGRGRVALGGRRCLGVVLTRVAALRLGGVRLGVGRRLAHATLLPFGQRAEHRSPARTATAGGPMPFNLHGRHLLSLVHHSDRELRFLLDLAAELKQAKCAGAEVQRLKGKNIALIFEKTSTRTRCAFEVAAYDQGAHVTFLDPGSSQIGHKESVKDTARVLGRMYDAIEYRGSSQSVVDDLAAYAGVPVFNGLTDEFHPTQMLADLLTMQENSSKALHEISFAFLGDGRNNVANSLLLVGAKLGMDVRIGAPRELWPTDDHVALCRTFAEESGARITVTDDPRAAVAGVDFVHTDVWVSMGEPVESWGERIAQCLPFQ